ncbi:MAG: DUF4173 domain-containing protein [Candidatus Magasanikbacteria bacterium]
MSLFSGKADQRLYRLLLGGLGLVLAVLYDVLAWKHWNGFGFVLFVSLYIVGFLVVGVLLHRIRQWWAFVLLGPVAILSIDVILFNNEFISSYVPVIIFGLLGLFSILITLERPHGHLFYFFQIPIIRRLLTPIVQGMSHMFSDLSVHGRSLDKQQYKKILIGFVIAIPLVLIFGGLFASADQIFADYIKRVLDLDIEAITVWRILRSIILWLVLAGLFYVIIRDDHALLKREYWVEKFDSTTVSTVLVVLNILFAVFVFIQLRHLFGSYEYVLDNRIIFSEYARKGFFELIVATGLSCLIFLIVYRSFAFHGVPRVLQVFLALFLIQTGVIAASALRRMNLYQEAYGFTTLRVYVEAAIYGIIIMLGAGVVVVFGKISFRKLVYAGFAIGIIALCIVSSINVDLKIAQKNIDRFLHQDKKLDMNYLSHLSIDILPAFKVFNDQNNASKLSLGQLEQFSKIIDATRNNINERMNMRDANMSVYNNRWILDDLEKNNGELLKQVKSRVEDYQKKKDWAYANSARGCSEKNQNGYYIADQYCLKMRINDVDVIIGLNADNYPGAINTARVYILDFSSNVPTYHMQEQLSLLQIPEPDYTVSSREGGTYVDDWNYSDGQRSFLLNDERIMTFDPMEKTYEYKRVIFQDGKYQLVKSQE